MDHGSLPVKQTAPDWLLAGILAAAGFLAPYIFLGMALPVSLAIGALCLAAGTQLFRRAERLPEVPGGVGKAELDAALGEGERKLAAIRALGKRIGARMAEREPLSGQKSIGAKIDSIAATVSDILAEIRRDPDDLKRARQFLAYYLDSTIAILEKYEKLSANDAGDPKIRASIERVETTLDTIGKAFEKQHANLLSNDVMDLDAELSLLENTINMEGLGD